MEYETVLEVRVTKSLETRLEQLGAAVGLHRSTFARSILTQFVSGQLIAPISTPGEGQEKSRAEVRP